VEMVEGEVVILMIVKIKLKTIQISKELMVLKVEQHQ
jgi:hypothetical protein